MTIAFLSSNFMTGLSSDTKPTNVPANSVFVETDTRTAWLFDGANWLAFAGGGGGSSGGAIIKETYDNTDLTSIVDWPTPWEPSTTPWILQAIQDAFDKEWVPSTSPWSISSVQDAFNKDWVPSTSPWSIVATQDAFNKSWVPSTSPISITSSIVWT